MASKLKGVLMNTSSSGMMMNSNASRNLSLVWGGGEPVLEDREKLAFHTEMTIRTYRVDPDVIPALEEYVAAHDAERWDEWDVNYDLVPQVLDYSSSASLTLLFDGRPTVFVNELALQQHGDTDSWSALRSLVLRSIRPDNLLTEEVRQVPGVPSMMDLSPNMLMGLAGIKPAPAPTPDVPHVPDGAEWACPNCGVTGNTGKFCPNCGHPRP